MCSLRSCALYCCRLLMCTGRRAAAAAAPHWCRAERLLDTSPRGAGAAQAEGAGGRGLRCRALRCTAAQAQAQAQVLAQVHMRGLQGPRAGQACRAWEALSAGRAWLDWGGAGTAGAAAGPVGVHQGILWPISPARSGRRGGARVWSAALRAQGCKWQRLGRKDVHMLVFSGSPGR